MKWHAIGCDTGKMEEIAFAAFNIKKLSACDISENMTTIIKNRFQDKNIECITSSVLDLSINETFDVIILLLYRSI